MGDKTRNFGDLSSFFDVQLPRALLHCRLESKECAWTPELIFERRDALILIDAKARSYLPRSSSGAYTVRTVLANF